MRFVAYFASFCVLFSPISAVAQHRAASVDAQRLIISDKAIADALATEQAAINTQRDSVKNGTIIGALLGAAIMGVGVTYLCNALKEPGDPPCWKSSGLAIAIGAGAGALGGAGLDALLVREPERFFLVQQPQRK